MDSEKGQLLCAHHNRLLPEGSLQVTPVPLPPRAIKLIRHDLKHDDVVPLRLATLLPQALRGSARERSQSAVLARELLAHPSVKLTRERCASVVVQGQEDLDQVDGAIRRAAAKASISRTRSVSARFSISSRSAILSSVIVVSGVRFKLWNSNPNRRPAVTTPGVRYACEGFAHALSGSVLHHTPGTQPPGAVVGAHDGADGRGCIKPWGKGRLGLA